MEEASAETPPTPRLGVHDISPGGCHPGWVREVGPDGLWVSLSPAVTGRIVPLESSDDPAEMGGDLTVRFAVGQAVWTRVLRIEAEEGSAKIDLSLRLTPQEQAYAVASAAPTKKSKKKPKKATAPPARPALPPVGSVVPVEVARVRAGRGLDVKLGGYVYGRAHLTELADEWVQDPLEADALAPGSFLDAVVLAHSKPKGGRAGAEGAGNVDVSLRRSAVSTARGGGRTDKHLRPASADAVEPGDLVRGYVKAISPRGCFVSLSRSLDGFVGIRCASR